MFPLGVRGIMCLFFFFKTINTISYFFLSLTHTFDGVSHIAKDASSQDVITGKRIEAKLRFTSDEAFIVSKRKFTNDIESRVTSTHTRKLELEQQQSWNVVPDPLVEAQIKALDGNLTAFNSQEA